jgi:cell division protease FtsH
MDQFTASLRVAKYIAKHLSKDQIDIHCLEIALCFFEHNEKLDNAILRCKSDFSLSHERMQFGELLLGGYESEPKLQLDSDASKLRRYIEASAAANELMRFPFEVEEVDAVAIELARNIHALPDFESVKRLFPSEPQKTTAVSLYTRLRLALNGIDTFGLEDLKDDQISGDLIEEPSTLGQLRIAMHDKVLDQPLAIREILEELQAREWGLLPSEQPALFVLLGPPSCGKTLMAQVIGEALSNRKCLKINMATYTSANEGFGLTGLRAGYDSAAAGPLTSFVHENPDAIVILENFDRAHPNVQRLLTPLFTEGTLRDEYGFGSDAKKGRADEHQVSFKKTTILLTTTLGQRVYERADYSKLYQDQPAKVIALLREELSQADSPTDEAKSASRNTDTGFRNALGNYLSMARLVPFRTLGLDALQSLSAKSITAFRDRLTQSQKSQVDIEDIDSLALALTLSQGPEINAKEVETAASRQLLAAYMAHLAERPERPFKTVSLRLEDPTGIIKSLRQAPPAKVLSDLLRRSQSLSFTVDTQATETSLSIRLKNLEMQRVPVASDYGNEGGFTIEVPHQKFDEVFGHTHIKQRLTEVVRLLKNPAHGTENVIGLPKGMLLYGRPGTGKTMLAKALAAEADLPFIAVTGPDLLDIDLIKTMFQRARKFAPCLVFMDEIDALGVRGQGGKDICINQLLTEIDGFVGPSDGNIFVIAATNYPEKVDSALTRSGRLDLCLEVPMLDREARRHFIDRLMQLPGGDQWDANLLVEFSAGMTGADLEKLCREGRLDLIRTPRTVITQAEILEQLNTIKHGARRQNPPLREQMEATAFHEAGHAIVSLAVNPDVRIEQVTIVPRGDALGFTAYTEESLANRNLNRQETMDLICVALAGRIAQSTKFPGTSAMGGDDAGASSDLNRATSIAWNAVTRWGLDEEFGWIALERFDDPASGDMRRKAEIRAAAWIDEGRKTTTRIVQEMWGQIESLAMHLLSHEMIDGESLQQLIRGK